MRHNEQESKIPLEKNEMIGKNGFSNLPQGACSSMVEQ